MTEGVSLLDLAPEARVLVVGSRGLGAGPHMMLGSTSRALVEFAPCPVLVVRPGSRALAAGSGVDATAAAR